MTAMLACGNAPTSRLFGAVNGRNTLGEGVTRIRETPGGRIITTMPEGAQFIVLGDPVCKRAAMGSWQWWWRIRLPNGIEGYAPEGSDGVYWLEPLPNG